MRIALLADFPVHILPGHAATPPGHHATWLPPLSAELEPLSAEIDLHWITCTKAVDSYQSLPFNGQTFHILPRNKLSLEMLTRFWGERKRIAALLAELKPDLVHGWGTEQGYALAANDFPGSSLISLQGILQAYCKAAPMPWLTRLQARHEAHALRDAQQLTVESPWGENHLRLLAPQAQIHLLEYGAAPECFTIERVPSETPTALFVGSLTRLKGIETLLAAFTDPRLAGIELTLLGHIPPEIAKRSLPANIRLLGHRSPAEVRESMARAWCLVHPTWADTSPNCVKEARVIGLPVITTPNGGQTQYVTHERSGILHDPGDTEGLIQGLLTVTTDIETSLRMGFHDRDRCRTALASAATAMRLHEIYRRLAPAPGPP